MQLPHWLEMDLASVWCVASCYSIQSTKLHYLTEVDSHTVFEGLEQYTEKHSFSD